MAVVDVIITLQLAVTMLSTKWINNSVCNFHKKGKQEVHNTGPLFRPARPVAIPENSSPVKPGPSLVEPGPARQAEDGHGPA